MPDTVMLRTQIRPETRRALHLLTAFLGTATIGETIDQIAREARAAALTGAGK